jgi:type IV pilus assembly protein PilC
MKITRALKSSMMYPMALMTVAIIVIAVMMIYVVPVFVQIFSSASIELPLPTRMIMSMSDFFRSVYMVITVAAIFGFYKFFTNKLNNDLELRMKLDR